jgi:hypothetical protein
MVCPHCGTTNSVDAEMCAACGSPIGVEAPQPERRYATVLFADLVDLTAFAEDRDPEDVHAVVDRPDEPGGASTGRGGWSSATPCYVSVRHRRRYALRTLSA